MGCVQAKGSPYTPRRGLEKLKKESGFYRGISTNGSKPIAQKQFSEDPEKQLEVKKLGGGGEGEKEVGGQRTTVKKIGADELVDGWPKWLLDHIPKDILDGLGPKTADSYEKLAKVGQGTYSNVYKARDRDTRKIVALKKVRFDTSEPESVKFMAREIIVLKQLDHPNIIKLEGLATSRMQYSLYLVFDFMQSDLAKIISRPEKRLVEPQVKCYMQQLLSGLQHCHERGILHRDIKGSNLLIDKNGVLKIADFGLANYFQPKPKRPLTSRVVTLWYRAPELLLGSTDYGVGIDLWSAGCLLAEMFVGKPIMPGRTEVEQLHRIFKLCGSPSEDYWKRMKPPTTFRPPQYKSSFHEVFTNLPSSSFTLLTKLLALEPAYRGTASSSLQNEFFSSIPLACDVSDLPAICKDDNESILITNQKKRASKIKQRRKVSITEPVKEDFESCKEERNTESSVQSQEMGTSATSSNSFSRRSSQHSPPHAPPPAFQYNKNQSARTEAHPNAMKNIKNYPLLLASIADTGNHITIENNRLTLNQRSMSTIDYRTIDLDKISKLFGLEDH